MEYYNPPLSFVTEIGDKLIIILEYLRNMVLNVALVSFQFNVHVTLVRIKSMPILL